MLTLIGENWLTLTRPNADHPRIHEENDLVRKEIQTALINNKPVVPTMFDGATYLAESDLPADIANLAWRNGISIQRETFEEDVHRLAEGLGLTKDNRKYGVYIASQAPLLGYIAYEQIEDRKKNNEPQKLIRPSELDLSVAAAAATGVGTIQAGKSSYKFRLLGGAVIGSIALAVLALAIWPSPNDEIRVQVDSPQPSANVSVIFIPSAPIENGTPFQLEAVLTNTGEITLENSQIFLGGSRDGNTNCKTLEPAQTCSIKETYNFIPDSMLEKNRFIVSAKGTADNLSKPVTDEAVLVINPSPK